MLTIHYFASIREALELEIEEVDLPEGINSITGLIEHLVNLHGEQWNKVLKEKSVLVAINQTVAKFSSTISDNDEIAFFPPVTGG